MHFIFLIDVNLLGIKPDVIKINSFTASSRTVGKMLIISKFN